GHDGLHEKWFADADMGRDRAAHVSGEEDRPEYRGARNEEEEERTELEDPERGGQMGRPAEMLEAIRNFLREKELHRRAHDEQRRRQERQDPPDDERSARMALDRRACNRLRL